MRFIILYILLTLSCTPTKNIQKNILSKNIIGRWCLTVNQTNYPSITFREDSLAIFDSRGDTVYRFKYYLSESDLFLVQPTSEVRKNHILSLTKDSLIFETLLEHNTRQSYYKCNQ